MTLLRQQALTGARWTIAARVGLQLVTWPITIAVMRLLDPGDYGVFAIAILVHGFVSIFTELGLGVALVQTATVSKAQTRMAASIVLVLNLVVMGLIAVVAPWMAESYEADELRPVMWALSFELLIVAASAVPSAMLERELRYRSIAKAHVAGGVSGSLATLVAALSGAGVWALVAGALVSAAVRAIGCIWSYGGVVVPGRVRFADLRPMVNVGGHTLAWRVLWFWSSQADSLLLGLQLTARALGFYNVASQLSMLPATKAMEAVNKVAFPLLCRSRDDAAQTTAIVDRLRALLALYGFGVCWTLAAVAPEFVGFVLGDKWSAAALPLALLSMVAPLRMLSAFQNTVVTALDAPAVATREQLMSALVVPTAVALGGMHGGLAWAASAWLVCFPGIFAMSVVLTAKVMRQPWRDALRPLWGPMTAAVAMFAAVEAARRLAPEGLPVGLQLLLHLLLAGVVFLGVLRWLWPVLLRDTRSLVHELLHPAPAGGEGGRTP